jgi:hypothetical protein
MSLDRGVRIGVAKRELSSGDDDLDGTASARSSLRGPLHDHGPLEVRMHLPFVLEASLQGGVSTSDSLTDS